MRNFKITIEYDGTAYCGWQRQPNGPTIQEKLEDAIMTVTGESVTVKGAGRTDAGVHALGQVASFTTSTRLSPKELRPALNANLPEDISVVGVEGVADDFDAQRNSRGKTYVYKILNRQTRSPLLRRTALFVPYPLDLPAMEKAAEYPRGKHDFAAFRTTGSSAKTTTRDLWQLTVDRTDQLITITLSADGFLYNMARTIVGTLIEVGRGKLSPEDFREILESRDRSRAGPTAPPQGLCLLEVHY